MLRRALRDLLRRHARDGQARRPRSASPRRGFRCHAHNEAARVAGLLRAAERGRNGGARFGRRHLASFDPASTSSRRGGARAILILAVLRSFRGGGGAVDLGAPRRAASLSRASPPKTGARRASSSGWRPGPRRSCISRLPHRLAASPADAAGVLGCGAPWWRGELTKVHEEALRGTLAEIRDRSPPPAAPFSASAWS